MTIDAVAPGSASSASPTALTAEPATTRARRPRRSEARPPKGETIAPRPARPRSAMPLTVALAPSSSSVARGTRMKLPCRITVEPKTPARAAANGRCASSRGSTAGRSCRSSTNTSRARSGTTARAATSCRSPPRSAIRTATIAAPRSVRPRASIGAGLVLETCTSPAVLTRSPTKRAAKTPSGTASTNSERHPNAPTRRPPMNGPIAALVATRRSNKPNAAPC